MTHDNLKFKCVNNENDLHISYAQEVINYNNLTGKVTKMFFRFDFPTRHLGSISGNFKVGRYAVHLTFLHKFVAEKLSISKRRNWIELSI